MLILGLILSVFAIGFFCWLLFTLAVYALPFFVAVTVGVAAYHHDSGLFGAFLVAMLAGAATLALGQLAFALVPSTWVRASSRSSSRHRPLSRAMRRPTGSRIWALCPPPGAERSRDRAILTGGTAFARMTVFTAPARRGSRHTRTRHLLLGHSALKPRRP